ncbi:hypothetical protein FC16_GL002296 [Loigolactobacillus coryniformis subsp. torquens DSM 20004 = KCTC 3535]|uniref:Antitoxin n=2 Tax=Loigolactobacillus coryniformis TaxID=1610 RepID=A0A0R1F5D7_9LACO|nr:hypothetical protein FD22_GL001009 [Loigolactobacillus coryniformis subsp. coryniformis KCTC 3167 = DSM 20001]KRK85282.1 hypothetical protein FC16_GL002296 [Loigolactobacillus coryniformis subsp. torquens DSM 20004 = KCTC 3535]
MKPMIETLPVSNAKMHLNRLVRELDRSDGVVVIRNMRTNDCVVLVAAHKWQQELTAMLGQDLHI